MKGKSINTKIPISEGISLIRLNFKSCGLVLTERINERFDLLIVTRLHHHLIPQ